MRTLTTAAVLAAALLAPVTTWGADATSQPVVPLQPASTQAAAPKDVTDTIKKAIELLEAGKNKETIELLAPPSVLKEEGGVDKIVKEFDKQAAVLLAALKDAQKQQPTKVTETLVTYPDSSDHPQIEFSKIDGKWYLK